MLDLEEEVDREELFARAAEELAERTGKSPDKLARALQDREEQSSTAVNRWLAVPHIVLSGQKTFELLMVRSREGIYFSEEAPEVHAVFILAGTMDERNFHLFSLSAIAQIAANEEFQERWNRAKNTRALKDVILLSNRMRQQAG